MYDSWNSLQNGVGLRVLRWNEIGREVSNCWNQRNGWTRVHYPTLYSYRCFKLFITKSFKCKWIQWALNIITYPCLRISLQTKKLGHVQLLWKKKKIHWHLGIYKYKALCPEPQGTPQKEDSPMLCGEETDQQPANRSTRPNDTTHKGHQKKDGSASPTHCRGIQAGSDWDDLEFNCLAGLPAAAGRVVLAGRWWVQRSEGKGERHVAGRRRIRLGRSRVDDRGRRVEETDWEGQWEVSPGKPQTLSYN